MKKSFYGFTGPKVAFLSLLVVLTLFCAGGYVLLSGSDNHESFSMAGGSGRVLELSRIYMPPGISLEVAKRFPEGVVPLPLSETDSEFLSRYLNGSDYIIEFEARPVLSYKEEIIAQKSSVDEIKHLMTYRLDIEDSHKVFAKSLSEMDPGFADAPEIRHEFYHVFNGVSVSGLYAGQLLEIAGMDYVAKIYPVKRYHMLLSESVPQTGASSVWNMTDSSGRTVTGNGMKIAVIDTGVDYTHPDLGSCSPEGIYGTISNYSLTSQHPYSSSMDYTWTVVKPGFEHLAVHFVKIDLELGRDYLLVKDSSGNLLTSYTGYLTDVWSPSVEGDRLKITLVSDSSVEGWGFAIDQALNGTISGGLSDCDKVVGGFDYINNDSDPIDDQGHGTHCASIAAGNGTLRGMAPDATILAYKVLDAYGYGDEDAIVSAIDRAVSAGADVISLSLGGSGSPDDALSTAVDNAVDAGVVVVVAAGNDGPYNMTISSPGCARKALTVGAMYKAPDFGPNRVSSLVVTSEPTENITSLGMLNSAVTPEDGVSGELKYAGLGFPQNFSGGGYSGKVALIERGEIPYYEKVENAYDAGAIGAVIYNNYYGSFIGDLVNLSSIPVVSISQSDGGHLNELLANGSVTVKLVVLPDPNTVADFSSRGPAYIYDKPDILAPGVEICAARWGVSFADALCLDESHVALSGTSMATPHMAGAAALLLQKHPGWMPLQVKAAFEYTADDQGLPSSVQGAGAVDVLAAVNLENPPPVAFIADMEGVTYETVKET